MEKPDEISNLSECSDNDDEVSLVDLIDMVDEKVDEEVDEEVEVEVEVEVEDIESSNVSTLEDELLSTSDEELDDEIKTPSKIVDGNTYTDGYFQLFVAKQINSHSLHRLPVSLTDNGFKVKMLPNNKFMVSIMISPEYKLNWTDDLWFSISGTYGDKVIKLADKQMYHKNNYIMMGTRTGQHSGFCYYVDSVEETTLDLEDSQKEVILELKVYKRISKLTIFHQLDKVISSNEREETDAKGANENTIVFSRLRKRKTRTIINNAVGDDNGIGNNYVTSSIVNITDCDFQEVMTKNYQIKLYHDKVEDSELRMNNYRYILGRKITMLEDKFRLEREVREMKLLLKSKEQEIERLGEAGSQLQKRLSVLETK